jgi:SAM-dependent methyltransferase
MEAAGKLQGTDYLEYWRMRIAKGPQECGHGGDDEDQLERQADLFFGAMQPALESVRPTVALEFGSGYGRILSRLRTVWPGTQLIGLDICPTAIARSWTDQRTWLIAGSQLPEMVPVGAVVTCTALQHVTDPHVFSRVTQQLRDSLTAGGLLIMVENVSRPGVPHVRDMDAVDYMRCFPGMDWINQASVYWRNQEHVFLAGVKR